MCSYLGECCGLWGRLLWPVVEPIPGIFKLFAELTRFILCTIIADSPERLGSISCVESKSNKLNEAYNVCLGIDWYLWIINVGCLVRFGKLKLNGCSSCLVGIWRTICVASCNRADCRQLTLLDAFLVTTHAAFLALGCFFEPDLFATIIAMGRSWEMSSYEIMLMSSGWCGLFGSFFGSENIYIIWIKCSSM